jgi:4-alpha-glucanotransferase
MRHAALQRIDHVLGLHRLYWIPSGASANEGLYVHYRAEEMYAALLLESHRHQCELAGEDLGTVPEEVRPALQRRGLYRLYVAQFSRGEEQPAANSLASLSTHDTRTFARFADEELEGDVDELLQMWTTELAASAAAVVMVTLEDLWCEQHSQNVPGTASAGNWIQRLRFSLPDLMANKRVLALLSLVAARRKKLGLSVTKRES